MAAAAGYMVWKVLQRPRQAQAARHAVRVNHIRPLPQTGMERSVAQTAATVAEVDWWSGQQSARNAGHASLPPLARKLSPSEAISDPASLLAMAGSAVPPSIRLEALRRLCEITDDEEYAAVIVPLLRNRQLPSDGYTVLLSDLRERPIGMTAAAMLLIAGDPDHPRRQEAAFWLRSVGGLNELPADGKSAREALERSLGQRVAVFP
jgi:hypothetical protein